MARNNVEMDDKNERKKMMTKTVTVVIGDNYRSSFY